MSELNRSCILTTLMAFIINKDLDDISTVQGQSLAALAMLAIFYERAMSRSAGGKG
jgi:hypothetical protein